MEITSQFRVDDIDIDKAKAILKTYETKYSAKYLLSQETGKETGKPHLQGWVTHTATDNTYRQTMARHYKTLGTHQKCFTRVKDYTVYVSYIINNDTKVPVKYTDVITNYTEEAFNELKSLKPFVAPITKKSSKDYYQTLLESIEDICLIDGKILYHKLPTEYLKFAPKKLNGRIAYDNVMGIAVRLEQKYPENTRVTNKILREVEALGDGLFDAPLKEWNP